MAVATANVQDVAYRIEGNQKKTVYDVTFDASYVTGGEVLLPATLGLNYVEYANATVITATGGLVNVANAKYDDANSKVLLYDETPAEIANAADVATTVVRVEAYGW